MNRIIKSAAIAAIAAGAVFGTAGAASAAETASGSVCTPSAASTEVTHVEYQWAALVAKGGLHWEYKWTATSKNPSTDIAHVWVKSLDLTKRGLPQITRTVVDTEAKGAVTCSVTLPQFDTSTVAYTPLANVTVPLTPHVKTYLYGVQGYDQNVPITGDVNVTRQMAGQFWIGYVLEEGYVASNTGTTHIDFNAYTADFGIPTVSGFGENGVVDYGPYNNGTWKVGSKVTLTSGSEFQTHGGTDTSGPVTRYRLVFTPNAGFTLPETLPGDGFKVGNSAVFHVYVSAPNVSVPIEVRFSDTSGKHINLPDVFDIEHTEYPDGAYWSTQVRVNVINDTDTDQEFRIRYADVQDGDRVWVERAIFTDGMPNNVVPANSSRPLVLDVWHNAVSGADVPDDLTLDFGFELA